MAPSGEGAFMQYGTGEKGYGITEDGLRKLKQPRGISITPDGDLLVADFGSHCVLRFKPNDSCGKVVAGEEGKMLPSVDILKDIDRPLGPVEGDGLRMKRPIDVCAHESGVLVLDTEVCRIQHYLSLGQKATTVVPPPSAPHQKSVNDPQAIKYPRSMLVRPDGDIIVCDTWSHRILRFSPNGSAPEVLAGKPNSSAATPEQMNFPSGMAFDSRGRLYVTDTNNHRVQCFAPGETSGTTVAGSREGMPGAGPGELNMPTGICIDPRDDSLLVADRMNARVLRFPASGGEGEVVAGVEQQLQRPWGVCLDADGAIYISDERRAIVLKMEAPSSVSSRQQVAPQPRSPNASPTNDSREDSPQGGPDSNDMD